MDQSSPAERRAATRRALVVGGDGEIGSAISAGLVAEGADVAIASIDPRAARELAERLSGNGGRTAAYEMDITDPESVASVVDDVQASWGGIDVLVNCAGLLRASSAEDFTPDDWRAVVDVNLTGAFLVSQAVARLMIKNGEGGRMVHLSSVRAMTGLALGGFVAYGASKAGVHLLIKQLATEWGRHGIAVNGVAAGFVRSALSAQAMDSGPFAAMVAARTPLGRVAEVAEIADAALFLAGPRSSFVNGQVLVVDGGLSASQ